MADTLESKLEGLFRDLVRKGGGMAEKWPPARWGVPDRVAIYPGGRVYLVELKQAKGRTRPAQSVWHRRAAQRGVQVHVLHGEQEIRSWCAARARETKQLEAQA